MRIKKSIGLAAYFLPPNIQILITYIRETHVYEERRGGEEVGMDLGYRSC